MRRPIPDDALDDRLFFGGTAGSGKTYNACGCVERLLDKRARVVIPDPLSVWWGLRLLADGKTPSGYDVVIFGGPHGDLSLTEHAGGLIGETVAGMKESCILDLSGLGTKAAERRFMLDFLTALYRHTHGEPLHVVFDEADMWAPQSLVGEKDGPAPRLLGMMETIVRRGRVKGFIPWLISQRPAVLNKNVLSQADGIIAFKLTSSQDRDAIGAWVEGQADKATWREMYGDLATMQRGQGVVWMPARDILETVQFPEKKTFDSSRTPKRGEKKAHAELKPIDLGALKDRLAKVETEAKASDPKELRRQIAQLQRTIREAPTIAVVDAKAEQPIYERGYKAGLEWAFDSQAGRIKDVGHRLTHLAGELGALKEALQLPHAQPKKFQRVDIPHTPRAASPPPAAPPRQSVSPLPQRRDAGANGKLAKAERLILTVLAQHGGEVPVNRLAAIAGYSANGGGFRNALGAVRSAGYVEGLRITQAGLDALGAYEPMPTGPELLRYWLGRVGKAERSILEAASQGISDPASVAEHGGYEPSGGGWRNALGRLRTLGLISARGAVELHEDLR